jgi:FkbM family methyltransferase
MENTMDNFAEVTSMRYCGIEGVHKLLWVTQDSGAFGNERDGPLGDWIHGKSAFMEHVKDFDTVISAGGNCGMYVRFYGNYFKNVYTFEPDPLNYYCLDRNCVGESYHKVQGALGNSTDKLTLQKSHVSNVGMHKIDKKPGDVQMYRIDDLDLKSCGLIHLDVEGFEQTVLEGSAETIKKFQPVVILEAGHGGSYLCENHDYQPVARLRMDVVYIPK